ncbi:hypothetical protein ACJX0J_023528, partial [Zea mays]
KITRNGMAIPNEWIDIGPIREELFFHGNNTGGTSNWTHLCANLKAFITLPVSDPSYLTVIHFTFRILLKISCNFFTRKALKLQISYITKVIIYRKKLKYIKHMALLGWIKIT